MLINLSCVGSFKFVLWIAIRMVCRGEKSK
jgi:hypothetical protein